MRWLERRIILDVVDSQWKDHLLSLDHLKEGIGLRGYGQKDPLVEFKKEAFVLFEDMMARIDNETIRYLFHIQVQQNEQPPQGATRQRQTSRRPQLPPPACRAAVASAAARASEARLRSAFPTSPANGAQTRAPAKRASISNRPRTSRSSQARPRRRQSRPQRPLPLRLRQKIQKMPRRQRMSASTVFSVPSVPSVPSVLKITFNPAQFDWRALTNLKRRRISNFEFRISFFDS